MAYLSWHICRIVDLFCRYLLPYIQSMPWFSSSFLLKFLNDEISQNSYNLFQEFPKSTDIFGDLIERLTGLKHVAVLMIKDYSQIRKRK